MTDQIKAQLADLLAKHDWWYQMSDDSRWYDSGRESEEAIKALIKQIGNDGVDMYNAAKPQEDWYHKMEYQKV
jgi:hypothetical protein